LKVVPLSKRRLPPVKLKVEPPSTEALLDWEICNPLSDPVRFPAVLVVVPTVLPTALVVVPPTFPTLDVMRKTELCQETPTGWGINRPNARAA